MTSETGTFDPRSLLDALTRHAVDFVLIGGVAANALGSPSVTGDLDICYARDRENLDRLASACREVHATLRGAPPGLPFILDGETLWRGDSFTFDTDFGSFDVLATPSGTNGFAQLRANAHAATVMGRAVWVCALEDLIRMKIAAGRLKDRIELEILGALRDEVEGRPED